MERSRKLAAIMFTDIQGYTALMQKSESSAIAVRNRHREIFDSVSEKHQGRIIQYYGDGTLSIFQSAVQAVQCAVEMQKGFLEQPVIPVRIGIHVGDIVITKDDIIGDAVNLASRVESLGVVGSVLVSGKVVEELKNHQEIKVKSMGHFHFKNDTKSREIFAISEEALVMPKSSQLKGKTKDKNNFIKPITAYLVIAWVFIETFNFLIEKNNWDPGLLDLLIIVAVFGLSAIMIYNRFEKRFGWKAIVSQLLNIMLTVVALGYYTLNPTRIDPSQLRVMKLFDTTDDRSNASLKSVAVLPFSNYTGDENRDFLFAGMHDGLISEIGQLGTIRITSRTSTLAYANTTKNMKQIAKELQVDALIEASMTLVDTMIELRLQLINVFPEEKQLWSHSYRTRMSDLPNMYKEVTKNVAFKINAEILPEKQKQLNKTRTAKPGAYEAFLKGQYYAGFLTPEGLETAQSYFERAIEIDPEFSLGHSGLSLVWGAKKQMRRVSTEVANPRIKKFHGKAMQLDNMDSENWIGQGAIRTWTDYDWEGGEKGFLKSIELNPNKAEARAAYAHLLMILGRLEEAREQMDFAEKMDPLNPWVLSFSGVLYFHEGKVLTATKQFEKLKDLEPDHPMLVHYLLNKYAGTFQHNLAVKQLKRYINLPDNHDIIHLIDETYQKSNFKETVETTAKALEDISKTTYVSPMTMELLYEIIGDKKKRIFWLQKMHETKDPNLPYFAIKSNDPIQKDPAYIEIMQDIGLW